ncbi:MAG: hypothetical protein WKF96_12265, partial [Solirubrobacteraceae bacterium]
AAQQRRDAPAQLRIGEGLPHPVPSAEPVRADPGERMTLLLPVAIRDALLREHVETTTFVDPVTGRPYEPAEPPVVTDPAGDEDSK